MIPVAALQQVLVLGYWVCAKSLKGTNRNSTTIFRAPVTSATLSGLKAERLKVILCHVSKNVALYHTVNERRGAAGHYSG